MLRRKEYKRKREARRRHKKRHPLSRVLKRVYANMRVKTFLLDSPLFGMMTTPFIPWPTVDHGTVDSELHHPSRDTYRGREMYWEVKCVK